MTNLNRTLGEQIEQLVREHIAACREAAREAVDRAFTSANARPTPTARTPRSLTRRASAEVAALSERLYEAVCARPGEMMTVLGPALGASPRALHRPMAVLKQAGRVRSVGQRHMTRYFPTVGDAAPL